MKEQRITTAIILFFCLGIVMANAQYPPPPPYAPPPPYYAPPPPPVYVPPPPGYAPPPPPPPPSAPWFPTDAGPYFRFAAGPSFYMGGTLQQFGGPVNSPVSFDTGFALDAVAGYAFNKYVGLDFNTGYLYANIHSVQGFSTSGSYIDNIPFLFDVTLSLPIPHSIVVPYIGGGVGGSSSSFSTDQFGNAGSGFVFGSGWDTVFAYQAFAGLRFKLSQNFSLGLGYKYFATDNTTYGFSAPFGTFDVGFKGIQTHSVLFALQWNF